MSSAPDHSQLSRRLAREYQTLLAMVRIYCRHHHGADSRQLPCQQCTEFLQYARQRLAHCRFQDQKPTCGNCPIHCYQKRMQAKAREIMRYAGPRMVWRHPVMAFRHLLDSRKPIPHRGTNRPT